MQIDFHHGVTYVIARLAGMNHKEADIISYCAQYVDDATNEGPIKFDNGATYSRMATAHKMLDYKNFSALKNHQSWVPFHFLPGNDLKPAGEGDANRRFIYKLICQPGSYVAKDMVRAVITAPRVPYSLHRLGITMHVYVDTWAHYGFCGTTHEINRANEIKLLTQGVEEEDKKIKSRLKSFFGGIFDNTASDFVDGVQPLGHGSVLSYPDQPYLHWKYTNGLGDLVERNNTKDFMQAAQAMYEAIYRFRQRDADAKAPPIPEKDWENIVHKFSKITNDNGEKRHEIWLDAIRNGEFSFGKQPIEYIPKGAGSWKHKALGTTAAEDTGKEVFHYQESFLTSDWKMFHDAAKIHKFTVLHDILPRYGISVG